MPSKWESYTPGCSYYEIFPDRIAMKRWLRPGRFPAAVRIGSGFCEEKRPGLPFGKGRKAGRGGGFESLGYAIWCAPSEAWQTWISGLMLVLAW
jgi:hypothetical protein